MICLKERTDDEEILKPKPNPHPRQKHYPRISIREHVIVESRFVPVGTGMTISKSPKYVEKETLTEIRLVTEKSVEAPSVDLLSSEIQHVCVV